MTRLIHWLTPTLAFLALAFTLRYLGEAVYPDWALSAPRGVASDISAESVAENGKRRQVAPAKCKQCAGKGIVLVGCDVRRAIKCPHCAGTGVEP
jgi:hypothetical protein